jgi:hypothetical protein
LAGLAFAAITGPAEIVSAKPIAASILTMAAPKTCQENVSGERKIWGHSEQ